MSRSSRSAFRRRKGPAWSRWTRRCSGLKRQIREIPGVELLLTTVGTRGFGGVNRAEILCPAAGHRNTRVFARPLVARGACREISARRSAATSRSATRWRRSGSCSSSIPTSARQVRNLTSLRQGRRSISIFRSPVRTLRPWNDFSEALRMQGRGDSGHRRCRYDAADR